MTVDGAGQSRSRRFSSRVYFCTEWTKCCSRAPAMHSKQQQKTKQKTKRICLLRGSRREAGRQTRKREREREYMQIKTILCKCQFCDTATALPPPTHRNKREGDRDRQVIHRVKQSPVHVTFAIQRLLHRRPLLETRERETETDRQIVHRVKQSPVNVTFAIVTVPPPPTLRNKRGRERQIDHTQNQTISNKRRFAKQQLLSPPPTPPPAHPPSAHPFLPATNKRRLRETMHRIKQFHTYVSLRGAPLWQETDGETMHRIKR